MKSKSGTKGLAFMHFHSICSAKSLDKIGLSAIIKEIQTFVRYADCFKREIFVIEMHPELSLPLVVKQIKISIWPFHE